MIRVLYRLATWAAQPLLRRADAWAIPFSCLRDGFAIFWEWQALQMKEGDGLIPLFGLIFAGLGLYLMLRRF
ncbi:hypothetical protein [Neisseria shayeganii]|uniref:Uncharacterized protein n=1 Tax=Neisseria shayeganii TaxID=607712 RepID=A0A7D7SGA6_9NEIS|nr:hypothetical protein [Neisseria shayeganii]QMT40069.1 hypothetical protein H3L94_09460 [Neisseria shayeganii]